jgi:signal transduction histidine kinase
VTPSRSSSPLLLLLLMMTVALGYVLGELHNPPRPEHVTTVSEAVFQAQGSTESGVRSLPDDWSASGTEATIARYSFLLNLPTAPNELWGVSLPAVVMNAELQINGVTFGSRGSFGTPVARNWNRPLYFTIPPGILRAGFNHFEVLVRSEPAGSGLLAMVHVGSDAHLRPFHERRHFLTYSLSQFIVIMLVFMAGLMLILHGLRPADSIYGWYALACLAWGLHNLNLVVVEIPVPTPWWDWLNVASMVWLPVLSTVFIHRFLGLHTRRFEAALFAGAAALCLALAVLPQAIFYGYAVRSTNTLILSLGLYPVMLLGRHYFRRRHPDVLLLFLAGLLMVLLGVHDLLVVNQVLPRPEGFLLHYSAPVVLTVFTGILLKRFVQALHQAEDLSRHLDGRVKAKHEELTSNYKRMQRLERERVLVKERERLTRDMHDGMGGHLVSLMAQIDTGHSDPEDLRQGLQDALDDLRLMIDSMEDVGGDLPAVLAMFRGRIEAKLERAGLRLVWAVDDLPPLHDLGPERALHILRILQESVTNALRHAKATVITVRTGQAAHADGRPGIFIEISDDGCGYSPERSHSGRGLLNMRQRAQHAGGELQIDATGEGIGVRLWLPALAGDRRTESRSI